ncbi:MAG: response regulator, partial [Polyangiaceae bacterium]|nr:response regulator [Polyangiaceae bacterium]
MAKSKKPLILVADDEPSTLALVSARLSSSGYEVIEAADGDEAWSQAIQELPDLVVLDVMMPGMSGWEVCRKIRGAVSLAHTGIIMLTGIGEALNSMTSPLYGADGSLDKPFDFKKLSLMVAEVLAQRQGGSLGRAKKTKGLSTRSFKTAVDEEEAVAAKPKKTAKKTAAKKTAKRTAKKTAAKKTTKKAAKKTTKKT